MSAGIRAYLLQDKASTLTPSRKQMQTEQSCLWVTQKKMRRICKDPLILIMANIEQCVQLSGQKSLTYVLSEE